MNDVVSEEDIEGARAYEALHVPALFQQWAPIVLDAAGVTSGQSVLDLACGTGVLAREAVQRVGNTGSVAGLDANPGMLVVARELGPGVHWHHGLADNLPYEDGSYDAVVSQFGLMFFPDRLAALREMLRVLAPGGRFAVAVWDSLDKLEAYPEEVELFDRIGGQAAADALRAPFVLGDRALLTALFEESGASSFEVSTHCGQARFPSLHSMVEADLRGWLPVMGVLLDEDVIAGIIGEAETALGRYLAPDGTVEFNATAHIVAGTRG